MINAKHEIIVNSDIILKRFAHDNDQTKFDLIVKNHDHLLPWLPWANYYHELSDMEKFTTAQIAEFDAGTTIGYDVFYKNQLVGSIDLHTISEENHSGDIGYWLDQDSTGKGIMTHAVKALINHSFKDLGMHRITIKAATENTASIAVAKRAGLKHEATLQDEHYLDGRYYDTELFAIINHL